jgi:hypothetical protein
MPTFSGQFTLRLILLPAPWPSGGSDTDASASLVGSVLNPASVSWNTKRATRVPVSSNVRMNSASNMMTKWYQYDISVSM